MVSLPQYSCPSPQLQSIPFEGTIFIFAATPRPPPGFCWRPCAGNTLTPAEKQEREWKLKSAACSSTPKVPAISPSTPRVIGAPSYQHQRSWTGDPLPPEQELEIQRSADRGVTEAVASLITSIPDSPPQEQPSMSTVHLPTPVSINRLRKPPSPSPAKATPSSTSTSIRVPPPEPGSTYRRTGRPATVSFAPLTLCRTRAGERMAWMQALPQQQLDEEG